MANQGNDYVKVWAPDHPLCDSRGALWQHRVVLFEAIGPGPHPCHWCGRELTWRARRGTPPRVDDLVVDHLDGDRANNARENLVASCQPCNVSAGYSPGRRISEDETYRIRNDGSRLRAQVHVCLQCGEGFLREPSAAHEPRYCSVPCARAALRRETCRRGHPRSGDNLSKAGACKECQRLALARYRARKAAARKG
jgi:hypothetical protein